MKKICLIILLVSILINTLSQPTDYNIIKKQSTIDSLKERLAASKPDSNRVRLLWHLSNSYGDFRTLDIAIGYIKEAVVLAKKVDAFRLQSTCHRRLALLLEQKGLYTESLNNYLQALDISERTKDKRQIGANAKQIGIFFVNRKDYIQARKYLFLSKDILEKIPGDYNIIFTLHGLGSLYYETDQLDSALFYFEESRQESIRYNAWSAEIIALYSIGRVHAKKLDYTQALQIFRKGVAMASGTRMRDAYSAHLYFQMALVLKQTNQLDSAVIYAKQAYDFAENYQNLQLKSEVGDFLSNYYVGKNNNEALRYLQEANKIKDSLHSVEKAQAVQNLAFQEQSRLKTIEAERLQARNRFRLRTILGITFTILAVTMVLYRSNRIKQRANALLKKQNETIELTLGQLKTTQAQLIQSEKMASLGELTAGIAHEIQNPLNFVNNFSEVNSELLDELEQEAKNGNIKAVQSISNALRENENKIAHHGRRAEEIVKGMLQHSRASSGKKEATEINKLVDESLRLSYHAIRAKDKAFNVTIQTDFDKSIGKILVVPQDIGRVLLNIINNAFYSVAEKKKTANVEYNPIVSISTHMPEESPGNVEIRVADNGVGVPEKQITKIFQPFFTTKPAGHGTGLGLSLSYDIIKAHGGSIKVNPDKKDGAEFIIHLPYENLVSSEVA